MSIARSSAQRTSLFVEGLDHGVEDNTGNTGVIVDNPGEGGLISTDCSTQIHGCHKSLCREVCHVELMGCLSYNLGTLVSEVLEQYILRFGFAKENTGRRLSQSSRFFPQCPVSTGIKAVEFVRSGTYKRVKGEGNYIVHLFEDVLGA